ncbi:hypothetical protein LNP74_33920 [Klebsiella pneumoniae subsp. pneumoniae]|nr:hypothetical protein [Klebsiella pneumoniae subsp. pneumoniae]
MIIISLLLMSPAFFESGGIACFALGVTVVAVCSLRTIGSAWCSGGGTVYNDGAALF